MKVSRIIALKKGSYPWLWNSAKQWTFYHTSLLVSLRTQGLDISLVFI